MKLPAGAAAPRKALKVFLGHFERSHIEEFRLPNLHLELDRSLDRAIFPPLATAL
jgi:hypothetical protein